MKHKKAFKNFKGFFSFPFFFFLFWLRVPLFLIYIVQVFEKFWYFKKLDFGSKYFYICPYLRHVYPCAYAGMGQVSVLNCMIYIQTYFTCLRAYMSYLPTCLCILRVYVALHLTCLHVSLFFTSISACMPLLFIYARAYMSLSFTWLCA